MPHNIVDSIHQSKPIDLSESYDPEWLRGKFIIITGGASGFGAAFSLRWVAHGAHIIVADINVKQGNAIVEELRKTSLHSHFIECDVTNWKSQVRLFRTAAKLSPHGGIDGVVANAGMSHSLPGFEVTGDLDVDDPPQPQFKVLDVNLLGVLYTTKLAIFWLQKNPRSEKSIITQSTSPKDQIARDRHLLFIGSMASIAGMHLHEYTVSKHAVLGLFGIRVNLLMPYFIDTPLVSVPARLLLAGSNLGKEDDVVDAGTRMMADHNIRGRSLVIGPEVFLDDDGQLVSEDFTDVRPVAVWEVFAHDHEEVDAFTARFVRLLNRKEIMRGWIGWISDTILALTYPLRRWVKV